MRVVNYSSLRQNLKEELDTVIRNRDITIVARNVGQGDGVLISEEEYNSINDRIHKTGSLANLERLVRSVNEETEFSANCESEEPWRLDRLERVSEFYSNRIK